MNNKRVQMIENKVKNYIDGTGMISTGDKIVIGVSGGADSVCLLRMLVSLSAVIDIKIYVAHINHGIRETASRDEQFVKELCEQFGLTYESHYCNIEKLARETKTSCEEAGRNERYVFFRKCMEKYDANKLAVAHNRNDNAETIIFNMARGSALTGMAGIKPINDWIIRPLLCLKRDEIEEYLCEKGQEYMTDETNLTLDYSRNVIRNVVLNELSESINENAVENISRAGDFARAACDFVEKIARQEYEKVAIQIEKDSSKCRTRRTVIDREKFVKLDRIIMEEIVKWSIESVCGRLKDITRRHIDSVVELAKLETGKRIKLPYGLEVKNSYGRLLFEADYSVNTSSDEEQKKSFTDVQLLDLDELEKNNCMEIEYINEKILIKLVDLENASEIDKTFIKNEITSKNNYTKCFDYDKLGRNIVFRKRETGDFLCINSEGKRKSLKDYFIDSKIDRQIRDNVTLLAIGSHIAWVMGYRTSNSFYVTEDTRRVLIVELQRN